MIIVVDKGFWANDHGGAYDYFLYENFRNIISIYPEHDFVFLFDRPHDNFFLRGKNIKAVHVSPAARNPFWWKLWYDVRVPAVLKKYKADVFVGCDGICSLSTRIPQCLLLHDLSFLRSSPFFKKTQAAFYKRSAQKFLNKAQSIGVSSSYSKEAVVQHFKVDADKINVIPCAVKEVLQQLTDEKKAGIKNKLTGGKEYFINTAPLSSRENLINLLKAFSVFKKKQASNWKLVLTGKSTRSYKEFAASLQTYKYRDDVIITNQLNDEELSGTLGSAYALVYPSFEKDFAGPVLEAMASRIPVITSADSSMQELAKDAALYCDPADHNAIAEQMLIMYKDENLRGRLIEKGNVIAKQYDWHQSSEMLWQTILKAVG